MLIRYRSVCFSRFLSGWRLALLLLLVVNPARADDLKPLASEAMSLSGTQALLEGLGEILEAQSASDPRMAKLDKHERAQILELVKNAMDGNRMADELTTMLANTHDRERLTAAVETMRDSQFQKTTRLLVDEGLKTTDPQILAYTETFAKTPPDAARVQLIQQLDDATDGARIIADMRYEAIEAMFGDKATAEDRAKLTAMRAEIETSAKNEFVARNLYATRKLDPATLEAYVRAHQNEPMGWLARQLGYGIQRAVVQAVAQVAQKMATLAPVPSPGESK